MTINIIRSGNILVPIYSLKTAIGTSLSIHRLANECLKSCILIFLIKPIFLQLFLHFLSNVVPVIDPASFSFLTEYNNNINVINHFNFSV